MIDRFLFHGFAVGLQGRIRAPFDEIIPVQAASALPETGGYGSARVDNFRFHEILSCTAAYSQVAGAKSEKGSYDSIATVTIEHVNLLNMVTADRVVARIASKHPDDPEAEPSVIPLGSYFENLRIAGQPVVIELATDTFTKFDTARSIREAYETNQDGFREEFDHLSLTGRGPEIPDQLRKYFPACGLQKPKAIPERKGVIACSLVRKLALPGHASYGHVIYLPGFGAIRLAEFKIFQGRRRITMVQVDLGSMPEGNVLMGDTEGNGTPW